MGISETYGGLLDKIEVVKRNSKLLSMTDNLIQLPKNKLHQIIETERR